MWLTLLFVPMLILDFVAYKMIFGIQWESSCNFFYKQIKSILEQHDNRRYKLQHQLLIAFYAFYALRCFVVGCLTIFEKDFEFQILQWDLIYHWSKFYYTNPQDCLFLLGIPGVMCLFCLAIEPKLYLSSCVESFTWQLFYDLVVTNSEIANSCLKKANHHHQFPNLDSLFRDLAQSIAQLIKNPTSTVQRLALVWFKMDRLDQVKMSQKCLRSYPNLSLDFRFKLLLVLRAIEQFNFLAVGFVGKCS